MCLPISLDTLRIEPYNLKVSLGQEASPVQGRRGRGVSSPRSPAAQKRVDRERYDTLRRRLKLREVKAMTTPQSISTHRQWWIGRGRSDLCRRCAHGPTHDAGRVVHCSVTSLRIGDCGNSTGTWEGGDPTAITNNHGIQGKYGDRCGSDVPGESNKSSNAEDV